MWRFWRGPKCSHGQERSGVWLRVGEGGVLVADEPTASVLPPEKEEEVKLKNGRKK